VTCVGVRLGGLRRDVTFLFLSFGILSLHVCFQARDLREERSGKAAFDFSKAFHVGDVLKVQAFL
jgi:hypothetical protein